MRLRLMKPIIYMLVGAAIPSCILFLAFHNKERLTVRVEVKEEKVANTEDIKAITDDDLFTQPQIDLSLLKKLYSRKVKYLREKEMIRTMKKRPNCTKEFLDAHPLSWCNDLTCKEYLAPVGSTSIFDSIARPLRAVQGNTFRRIQEVFGTHKLPKRKYVFLMGISENHYLESTATIRSLHTHVFPHIRNFTFYVYDLGITTQQKKMLEAYGQATVRKYPFEMLPRRFRRLKTYVWKPVFLQAHIDVGEFVMMFDASVRFKANLLPFFEVLSHTGFLITKGFHSHALQSSNRMFSYFGDYACTYASYYEFQGAVYSFHNEEFSRKLLLEPWVACAMDPLCLASDGAPLGCLSVRKYGQCHRFDQSVMTLMMVKLFRDDLTTFEAPRSRYHYVKQGRTNVTNYLEELHNKTLQT